MATYTRIAMMAGKIRGSSNVAIRKDFFCTRLRNSALDDEQYLYHDDLLSPG
jgi:hypothetical protein